MIRRFPRVQQLIWTGAKEVEVRVTVIIMDGDDDDDDDDGDEGQDDITRPSPVSSGSVPVWWRSHSV